ncbi:hypothetical protein SynMITS9220_00857 [Synechococcus sp. MIT S9220]|nr:hypothetical protein SynMITS9220_00857 [Synechococcus sp. MIT S9220]
MVMRDGSCARQLLTKAETVESPLDHHKDGIVLSEGQEWCQ